MPQARAIAGGLEGTYYDDFRDRVLYGRQELIDHLPAEQHAVWVELGAGTGRTLEFLGDNLTRLARFYLVDANSVLVDVAERRCRKHSNVTIVKADPSRSGLPDRVADVVIFSYSLTMMPDWEVAIEEARRLLSPGGWVGVVDFHGPNWPPLWLSRQDLIPHRMPSSEQLACLHERFRLVSLEQAYCPLPYLPGVGAPFYRFIGAR
jgi:S-adenosylmethionine-diacylgycerolhomoserine-N-methlytransferase